MPLKHTEGWNQASSGGTVQEKHGIECINQQNRVGRYNSTSSETPHVSVTATTAYAILPLNQLNKPLVPSLFQTLSCGTRNLKRFPQSYIPQQRRSTVRLTNFFQPKTRPGAAAPIPGPAAQCHYHLHRVHPISIQAPPCCL